MSYTKLPVCLRRCSDIETGPLYSGGPVRRALEGDTHARQGQVVTTGMALPTTPLAQYDKVALWKMGSPEEIAKRN